LDRAANRPPVRLDGPTSVAEQLTGGVQHPIMIRPPTAPDFPIALVAAKK
jgi:hypothetical protein